MSTIGPSISSLAPNATGLPQEKNVTSAKDAAIIVTIVIFVFMVYLSLPLIIAIG